MVLKVGPRPPSSRSQILMVGEGGKQTLSAQNAAALDRDLMSSGAFSLDQLMELAGLSVSQAGGDGLVVARHLWHYGYQPTIYYPKQGKNELYQRLTTQLKDLDIPFTEDFSSELNQSHHVVDAIFGFSFTGEVREPFSTVIEAMKNTSVPVTSVDAPSSWNIEEGPPDSGPGKEFHPDALVSLTAPKPLVKWFKGRHFVGGRFLTPQIAQKYDLDVPAYEGIDQILELETDGEKL
ncbi:MAG: hypothetical protein M1816_001440 [Peltula sp. TS41687]|nr:MAG: hypothetical protein M1816_001440 [Peltula sp. TS41687]